MNVQAPQAEYPIAERGRFTSFWWEFLRRMWTGAGYNHLQPMWDDDFRGANEMAAAIGITTRVAIDGDQKAPQLRDGKSDGKVAQFNLPNNYRNNTDIEPFILWAPQTADAGNIVTVLDWMAAPLGTALVSTVDDGIVTAAPEVAFAPVLTKCKAIDGSDLVKGSFVQLLPYRKGTDALDTLAADCVLLGVGYKYQIDGAGNESKHP